MALALVFGLRRSEVLRLRWKALDFRTQITLCSLCRHANIFAWKKQSAQSGSIEAKGELSDLAHSGKYTAPVTPVSARKRLALLGRERRTFPSRSVESPLSVFLQNNLRKIRFHDLRHSCAGILISFGVPLLEVQQWLGHSTYQTTADLYVHLDFSSKLKSSETINTILEKE